MNFRTIFTVSLLFAASASFAQQPGPDAIYLEQTKEYTLRADGSRSFHYNHKLQLNTYYAFHTLYGEDFIVYDPAYQQVKVNKSVTTMADGTQVASPENAFNELLPGFAANAPAWNRLRELVVTHTALERGAVIDFDYTLNTKKDFSPAFCVNEQLVMNSPVQKLTFIVHVPVGATFNYSQYFLDQKPAVSKTGGITTYTWVLKDLPAALREDFRSQESVGRPRLVFTAAPRKTDVWQEFSSQEAFKCEATPEMISALGEKLKDISDPARNALAIQEMVAGEFNTWQIPLSIGGFKVRTAAQVWKSNGGNESEKAVLMTALLRAAGLQASPVAVVADRYFGNAACNPALIEKTLVKVTAGGMQDLLLSAQQQDLQDNRYQLSGKRIINLEAGKRVTDEVLQYANNKVSLSGKWDIDSGLNANGEITVSLGGMLNPALRMLKDTSYASNLASTIGSKAKVNDVKLTQKGNISNFSFSSHLQGMCSRKGDLVFVKIPSLPMGSDSWHMTELTSSRTEPLEVPFAISESYDLYFSVPEEMKLASAPMQQEIRNESGSVSIAVSSDGRFVHVVKSLDIQATLIMPAQYESFRQLVLAWQNRQCRELILENK